MPQPGSRCCRQGEIPFSSDRKRMSVIVKHEGPEMPGDARSNSIEASGCKISQAAAVAESGPHTTVTTVFFTSARWVLVFVQGGRQHHGAGPSNAAGYRPGMTRVWAQLISLKRLRPLCDRPLGGSLGSSLTHYSKLGLRTLVVRLACHCSCRMAVHCKSIRMSSLLIYIVNASHVALACWASSKGVLQTCRGCWWVKHRHQTWHSFRLLHGRRSRRRSSTITSS